jgi:DNA-directed RNA polymerase specialized sigma24 family protein
LYTNPDDVLSLDQALGRLQQQDARKARLMEMVYFGGLNSDEAAQVLEVSVATVNRDLKLAKAWMKHELRGVAEAAAGNL